MEALTQWELELLHRFAEWGGRGWEVFWTFITGFGDAGIFWIDLSLALMIPKKTRKAGFSMGLALLIGVIVGNGILKNVFHRIRPYHLDPELCHRLAWGEMSKDFSFPSGHTLASWEAATALFLHHKKSGICAMVLAFLISVSRLFLLVHYPSDVLCGALLGIGFAFFAAWAVGILWNRYEQRFV